MPRRDIKDHDASLYNLQCRSRADHGREREGKSKFATEPTDDAMLLTLLRFVCVCVCMCVSQIECTGD